MHASVSINSLNILAKSLTLAVKFSHMKQLLSIIFSILILHSFSQDKDAGSYKTREPGFYQKEIRPSLQPSDKSSPREYFRIDFDEEVFPTDLEAYTKYWHTPPHSQGATGTCWCFATISFLESEIYRTTDLEVRLSEMYIVYWEYVERARAFVEERGNVYFEQGSEAASVPRIIKKYGIVPAEDYSGLPKGQKFHNHSQMISEMKDYLKSVKESSAWNTVMVVSTIRDILNKYMGTPPSEVVFRSEYYTPISYSRKVLKLNSDDYYSFMSTMSKTYNQKGELVEPDNWWHCDDYYNVDIANFMLVINNAIENGYTIDVCGDVSEPAYDSWAEVGIVPSFDIPSEYIDESAREMRLKNGTTTDDHCIHIIGFFDADDGRWYVIKDSGSGGFDGPNKGYRFLHEDYVKLKMMNIMVYKEAARPVLDLIIK